MLGWNKEIAKQKQPNTLTHHTFFSNHSLILRQHFKVKKSPIEPCRIFLINGTFLKNSKFNTSRGEAELCLCRLTTYYTGVTGGVGFPLPVIVTTRTITTLTFNHHHFDLQRSERGGELSSKLYLSMMWVFDESFTWDFWRTSFDKHRLSVDSYERM